MDACYNIYLISLSHSAWWAGLDFVVRFDFLPAYSSDTLVGYSQFRRQNLSRLRSIECNAMGTSHKFRIHTLCYRWVEIIQPRVERERQRRKERSVQCRVERVRVITISRMYSIKLCVSKISRCRCVIMSYSLYIVHIYEQFPTRWVLKCNRIVLWSQNICW